MPDAPLIAVLDDDEPFLELMQVVLEDEGYRVVLGNGPDAALDVIRRAHPALVILDVNFHTSPTQGLAILDALRADASLAGIAVIVCSASPDWLERERDHLAARCARPLPKPFDLNDLLSLVAEMLLAAGHTPPTRSPRT